MGSMRVGTGSPGWAWDTHIEHGVTRVDVKLPEGDPRSLRWHGISDVVPKHTRWCRLPEMAVGSLGGGWSPRSRNTRSPRENRVPKGTAGYPVGWYGTLGW